MDSLYIHIVFSYDYIVLRRILSQINEKETWTQNWIHHLVVALCVLYILVVKLKSRFLLLMLGYSNVLDLMPSAHRKKL